MKEAPLPIRYQLENSVMLLGSIMAVALLPIFIYNCQRTAKKGNIITPRILSIWNPLQGYSCAMLVNQALWQYGIPTHILSLQYDLRDETIGLAVSFAVASTQHWFADILLRQWSRRMYFDVDSLPVKQKGISATQYQDKLYRPIGVKAKNKSVDMMIGNLLFGHVLEAKKVGKYEQRNNHSNRHGKH